MRVFYGLIITAVILMIGACALKAYKKEGALARVVFLYELGAFICGIIFLVYTYVPGITITVLCKGLIMASFDWLLILLMYYTQYYTGMFKGIMGVKVFMIAYSLLETVAFLINTWTRWIFDITDISKNRRKRRRVHRYSMIFHRKNLSALLYHADYGSVFVFFLPSLTCLF